MKLNRNTRASNWTKIFNSKPNQYYVYIAQYRLSTIEIFDFYLFTIVIATGGM